MKYRFTRTRTALPTRHQYSASRHWILWAWLRGGWYKMVRLLWQQSPSSYKNYKDFLDDPVIHCTRDLKTCLHSSTTENMYTNVHSSATYKTIQNQKYFICPSAAKWEARFHVFIYERMGCSTRATPWTNLESMQEARHKTHAAASVYLKHPQQGDLSGPKG